MPDGVHGLQRAAGLRVRVVGIDSLNRKLRKLGKSIPDEVAKAVTLSAVQVQGEAQRLISRGTRSGRIYDTFFFTDSQGRLRKIGSRPPHRASAPGEPPKTDTGRLVSSIFAELDPDKRGASVGSDLIYSRYLEFGTQKMAARPWLQPTFDKLKNPIRDRIAEAIRRATRRQTKQ